MNPDEKVNEKRIEKVKNWLKNHHNFWLAVIVIFAIAIRLYYFILTKNQPLWWDESEYMSAAKSYAGIGSYELSGLRLPGFPLLISLFFMLGVTNEPVIRFAALFIPSLILIFLCYYTIKQMYPDGKAALIATAILSVLWEHLFYSNRFHTENFALIFEFLAILILFKCYIKKENIWFIKPAYSLFAVFLFSILSVLFRPGSMVFIPAIIAFLVVANVSWFMESKRKNVSLIVFALLIVATFFFIIPNMAKWPLLANYYHPENKISWDNLGVFWGFFPPFKGIPLLFAGFAFGLLIFGIDSVLNFKKIRNFKSDSENLEFKSDIFNFLLLLSVLFAFMFMIRPTGYEFRWFFPLILGMLAFTGRGIVIASQYLGLLVNSRIIAAIVIILVSVLGVYAQVTVADPLIKNKLTSYDQVKQSGLWLKENTESDALIVSASVPQHSYYTERMVYSFKFNGLAPDAKTNVSSFERELDNLRPEYLVVSAFEPSFTPEWAYTWANQANSEPIQVYFADAQQKQAILVIYKLKYLDSKLPEPIFELGNLSRTQ